MASRKPASRPHVEVHLDAAELSPATHIGNLFPGQERVDLSPSFEYTASWLASPDAIAIDPRLDLFEGEQHSPDGRGFGVFADCAPDRWGRVLMERREIKSAADEGRPRARMNEMFFMLGVNDFTRSGALRFRVPPGKAFVDDSPLPTPPATDLRELAMVARKLDGPRPEDLPEYARWLSMLVAPGTSLGGARPKATYSGQDGTLWLAKFPGHNDSYDWGSWEYLAYLLARKAGVDMPEAERVLHGDRYHTYLVKRFDRVGGGGGVVQTRRMYASAMTLTGRCDGQEGGSYLDVVQALEDHGGAGLQADLEQLFRRALFNLLVGNRDDHLRNHGFLLGRSGWRLAPAFDINPNPARDHHALSWDGISDAPDAQALLASAGLYRVDAATARSIVEEVRDVVSAWAALARELDIPRVEIELMRQAFLD
ncbi:HipA domain-containing protein [Xylophilus sp. GOD-11R]|uniref:type II toxin-antitoxin system HipA family toxin n=1 Tax=Xylophilus sp. GOD-11R TaxID=3089814 RepID=UPI00298D2C64|nr:HipA domain-containing protein [Xylophilus sp. GOD-11R]WPB56283.1 HipA domain-containing protein [Xylophilus sp. GOD-11R]